MTIAAFDQWFAGYLGQDELQVERLLRDKTATRFMIAWSLLETSCFGGFAKPEQFRSFAKNLVGNGALRADNLKDAAAYFHDRYQDKKLYGNLMHKQRSAELESILAKDCDSLCAEDLAFFVMFVVYRYRNNIFHGNKGVESWLRFKVQIERCIGIMQGLIDASASHNTSLQPTLASARG